jgi:hypothetical protein
MFFSIKDYRMSSDNQLSNAAVAVPAQESVFHTPTDSTDQVYRVGVLLIVALVYMAYISPMMRARALTEKNTAMRATFRWVDLLTKLVLVYLLAYAATCNPTISVVITLVFLLFSMHGRNEIVIETNKNDDDMIENMTGDEEDLDEAEDIDSDTEPDVSDADFEFERVNGDIIFESDRPILFPLNNGSIDPAMADDVGSLYDRPAKVGGLIVDTVAESEKIANSQGLGLDVLDMYGDDIHNVTGASDDMDVSNMGSIAENFDNNSSCGCGSANSESDVSEEDDDQQNGPSNEESVKVPKAVAEAIDQKVEVVADEVKSEKKKDGEDVKIPEEAKDEVRKAARFVASKMSQDGKTVTHHDLLMICRSVYGQMFRCKGIMKTVIADAKARSGEN